MNIPNRQGLITTMFLQYQISVTNSIDMIDNWLKNHPQKTQQDLTKLFNSKKVIIKNGQFFDVPYLTLKEAQLLATKIQQEKLLEIKDRWYHLRNYPQCFVGTEFVDCLIQTQNTCIEEAILIGQNLLEHNLISHVCQEHDFKNEFLFYRFHN